MLESDRSSRLVRRFAPAPSTSKLAQPSVIAWNKSTRMSDRRLEIRPAATFRRASSDDAAELFRVRTSVRENHQTEEALATRGVTRESLARMLASDDACGWCAEMARRIVAFAIARRSERDVFALFVEPGFEGRGLGSTLLDSAVEWLSVSGSEKLRLTTGRGTPAQSFYLNRGWADIGTPSSEVVMLERASRRNPGIA